MHLDSRLSFLELLYILKSFSVGWIRKIRGRFWRWEQKKPQLMRESRFFPLLSLLFKHVDIAIHLPLSTPHNHQCILFSIFYSFSNVVIHSYGKRKFYSFSYFNFHAQVWFWVTWSGAISLGNLHLDRLFIYTSALCGTDMEVAASI